MATGLPTIASPVGANEQIISDGQTGLLARSKEEWTEAIVRLANDADLRAKMGSAARTVVLKDYSIDRAKQVWGQLLD